MKHLKISAFIVLPLLITLLYSCNKDSQEVSPQEKPVRADTPQDKFGLKSYDWDISQAAGNEITHIVEMPGANALRLFFDDVNLKEGSYIEVTSLEDGETQKLTPKTLKEWENTTAYFNGDKVKVSMHLSGSKSQNSLSIHKILAEESVAAKPKHKSLCGKDDRWLDNDNKIGRIAYLNGSREGTGWIAPSGKIVTAGHVVSSADLIEFVVPSSRQNGTVVHSKVQDQFKVRRNTIVKGSKDWGVFQVSNNSNTGKSPKDTYGAFRLSRKTSNIPSIKIIGYGVDDKDRNKVSQAHVGNFTGYNSGAKQLRYDVDTKGGNSGSPVLNNNTYEVLGVHTHGHRGSDCPPNSNSATSLALDSFWNAIQ